MQEEWFLGKKPWIFLVLLFFFAEIPIPPWQSFLPESLQALRREALMGYDGSLRVITAGEYRKYQADRQHYVMKHGAQFELYRGWFDLDAALSKMGDPLSLAIRGNRPDLFAFDDDWDAYFSFVTPGLVKKIHEALGKIKLDDFLAALKEAGWKVRKREHESFGDLLKALKAAYREAAKKGSYLKIMIC
jgi:hypothetical protein